MNDFVCVHVCVCTHVFLFMEKKMIRSERDWLIVTLHE